MADFDFIYLPFSGAPELSKWVLEPADFSVFNSFIHSLDDQKCCLPTGLPERELQ